MLYDIGQNHSAATNYDVVCSESNSKSAKLNMSTPLQDKKTGGMGPEL